ncbi:MAG: radical SAM protein, partial [Planctomycetes bacterium]|nr:radical SAM protein [Planctomycetota bacterium]
MFNSPASYIEPVFRPPSEADSFIFQITNGCSWSRCTFCEMYTDPNKKFSVRPEAEVLAEIEAVGQKYGSQIQRVFLADGDAMVLSTPKLLRVLEAIQKHLPRVKRVGAYCLPKNLQAKSVEELKEINEAGLKIAYVGAESGDDKVLKLINKNETFASTVQGINALKEAGIKSSVMIINGLGGNVHSHDHAVASAQLANETQPEYLATLVISFPAGQKRLLQAFPDFELPDQTGLFKEMHTFLSHTQLDRSIFRSDHASNYLVLRGTLGRDKETLLKKI